MVFKINLMIHTWRLALGHVVDDLAGVAPGADVPGGARVAALAVDAGLLGGTLVVAGTTSH